MINSQQLCDLIIKPALSDLVMLSDDAVNILLFTCANESNGGEFLHQVDGPALGIYQMEPATHNDIWQNHIHNKMSLCSIMLSNFDCVRMPSEDRLIYDLRYATAMARIHYSRISEKLPDANDIDALWHYYKTYYNTEAGKADGFHAISKYRAFTKS